MKRVVVVGSLTLAAGAGWAADPQEHENLASLSPWLEDTAETRVVVAPDQLAHLQVDLPEGSQRATLDLSALGRDLRVSNARGEAVAVGADGLLTVSTAEGGACLNLETAAGERALLELNAKDGFECRQSASPLFLQALCTNENASAARQITLCRWKWNGPGNGWTKICTTTIWSGGVP